MMAESINSTQYDHHRGSDPLLRPTSRWRTGVFLTVNLAGFAVVNSFWQYLATGRWLDLSIEALHRGLANPFREELFVPPLSIFTHPWMIAVCALLLALVFVVPIVVAVLYHGPYAMLFVLIVAVVGNAPWLAFFQAGGSALAAKTRLRSDMPFLATLIGLAPLGVYIYVLFTVTDFPATLPLQRWILCMPTAAAALLAILAAAAVLALAKLTNFRPGVVWPVLLVLLAGPMLIFYSRVGPAELEYALISNSLAEPDTLFSSISLERWTRDHKAEGLNRLALKNKLIEDMNLHKRTLAARCEAFMVRHDDSDRAPAVLWIKGQAQSLTLDEAAYEGDLVKYDARFPLETAAGTWRRLIARYPASPHAGLAGWKLGQLTLRQGDVSGAEDLLQNSAQILRATLANATHQRDTAQAGRRFTTPTSLPTQRDYEYYENALLAVERLIWLMNENDDADDKLAAKAMAAYLKLNPHSTEYAERLGELAGLYENSKMGDNLKLAVALATRDHFQRAEMLIALSENKNTDVAIEANYALGRLALATALEPAIALTEKLKPPEDYFRAVIAARDNPWQRRSASRLAWLKTR